MDTLVSHEEFAVLTARVFLGLLFFFQGYDAIFRVKVKNIVTTYETSLERKRVPVLFIQAGSWFTSCAEFIGGILLIPGLCGYYPLCLLGISLVITSIGFGLHSPVWDMRFVFPRLVLLLFLLAVPNSWDTLRLDIFIHYLNK